MAKSIQDRLKHLEQTFRGCCNKLYKLITRVEDLEANTTAALLLKEDTANKSTSTSDSSSNTKFPVWSAVVSYVTSLGYQTASMVSSAISSALASFKTANYLDATSSIQNQLDSKLSIETSTTTGVNLSFTQDRVYGSLATPETGNITANVTGAKLGVTNIIIHNSGTAPTFGTQFKKLSGSGNYVTSVVNYIYVTYISSTEVIYSINQRA